MQPFPSLSDKGKLIIALCLLLSAGFLATTLASYYVSRNAIRESIIATELPLTSDNVYSEIQKDLIRPILISSMMARDTFLRDWVLQGERSVEQMTRYLNEVMSHYGAVTSFFVSENSGIYYSIKGVLKRIRRTEPRDAWYYRVRNMSEPYEINLDPDLVNRDDLTIFINYRVVDYKKRYIGATGVGLPVDTVIRLIDDYEQRYGRTIYLVDAHGNIALSGRNSKDSNIHTVEGLSEQSETILKASNGSFEFRKQGHLHFLNVRYIPELKWHLLVIKKEDQALSSIQQALYLNLLLCFIITAVVLLMVHLTIRHYQRRLEAMATTDSLTGLANRYALDILLDQRTREVKRHRSPMSAILLDIDHFKALNDKRGHLAGDEVLRAVAGILKEGIRASDIACRWGGEEFMVILTNTTLPAAARVASVLRDRIEKHRYTFEGKTIAVTISAGVASYRMNETRENFIARADALLYQAKKEGRNRVCSGQEEAPANDQRPGTPPEPGALG